MMTTLGLQNTAKNTFAEIAFCTMAITECWYGRTSILARRYQLDQLFSGTLHVIL